MLFNQGTCQSNCNAEMKPWAAVLAMLETLVWNLSVPSKRK